MDMPFDIEIDEREVSISKESKEILLIDDSNQLFIHGKKQSLNTEQEQLVTEMGDGYRNLLPAIAAVAAEGAEIGVKAATMTLNALFVDDPEFNGQMLKKLDGISETIKENINATQFNGTLISHDSLGDKLDNEIGALVEEAVSKASAKTILTAVSQVFSGDEEELNDLEFRMEMFSADMEAEIEASAVHLELEAERLCLEVANLDLIETKLQAALPAYQSIDLIHSN